MADITITTDDAVTMTMSGTDASMELDVNTGSGGGSGTSNHAQLSNLDYANSGHTGFASSAAVSGKVDKVSGYGLAKVEQDGSRHIIKTKRADGGDDTCGFYSESQADTKLAAKQDKITGHGVVKYEEASAYDTITITQDSETVPVYFNIYNKGQIDAFNFAAKVSISSLPGAAIEIITLSENYNKELRGGTYSSGSTIGIVTTGPFTADYTSGLTFSTGDTAPSIEYTGTGIIQWVGSECKIENGYSIFAPVANKTYDIVFYYNGTQFIGLVNGYTVATSNTEE